MANNCVFDMRITGKEDAIKEFIALLSWTGKFEDCGLGRTYSFDAEELEETALPGVFAVTGYGDCAWSILTAMCREYRGDAPSLESETERLGLVVEIYSSEPGCAFQEHYIFVKGNCILDDCVDYEEHWIEGYDSLDEYNKEFDTDFTEDMIDDDGNVCIGGFGDEYANFADMSNYFKEPTYVVSQEEMEELAIHAQAVLEEKSRASMADLASQIKAAESSKVVTTSDVTREENNRDL